jgi:predicted nucleotidyltransferase
MSQFLNPSLFILFDSQSRGQTTPISDFDIGIVADKPISLEEKNELTVDLSKEFSFPEDKIDLVDLNQASPLLQMEAAKSGKLLKGSEEDFFKFKLLAWKRHQHYLSFQRKMENLKKLYQRTNKVV